MGRLDSIRRVARAVATSGAGGAGIGALVGGAAAGYAGKDIGEGALVGGALGAIGGIGMNLSARMKIPKLAMETSAARARMTGDAGVASGAGMFNFAARKTARGSARAFSKIRRQYRRAIAGYNRSGIVTGGTLGGAGGFAYAMLPSNRGVTQRNATLDQKLEYMRAKREMQMRYNVMEAEAKKRIWQTR